MTAIVDTISYDGPVAAGEIGPFEAVTVRWSDDAAPETPPPLVLIVPNVFGIKQADIDYAERLARLGYYCFIVDMYGAGKRTQRDDPDFMRYMVGLRDDRTLLRDRILNSLSVARALPDVDSSRVAAIGFCFGGMCVLDLARSGADISGIVSLHGVFTPPELSANPITAEVLVCHGWDDPLCPPDAFAALAKELTDAGALWRAEAYGNAGHSFTDKGATGGAPGFGYNAAADTQSWISTTGFLARLFD